MSRVAQKIRIGPVTEAVLATVAIAGVISVVAVAPGATAMLAQFLKKKKYKPQQIVRRNIDSLIQSGLLKRRISKKGEETLELTSKGRWEVGIRGYLSKERSGDAPWDSMWRILVFDVPEHRRNLRKELRKAINLYGFKQLQKSVWVYPYPCNDFVKLIKQHLGITNDVLYLTSNHIENEKYLRREFKL